MESEYEAMETDESEACCQNSAITNKTEESFPATPPKMGQVAGAVAALEMENMINEMDKRGSMQIDEPEPCNLVNENCNNNSSEGENHGPMTMPVSMPKNWMQIEKLKLRQKEMMKCYSQKPRVEDQDSNCESKKDTETLEKPLFENAVVNQDTNMKSKTMAKSPPIQVNDDFEINSKNSELHGETPWTNVLCQSQSNMSEKSDSLNLQLSIDSLSNIDSEDSDDELGKLYIDDDVEEIPCFKGNTEYVREDYCYSEDSKDEGSSGTTVKPEEHSRNGGFSADQSNPSLFKTPNKGDKVSSERENVLEDESPDLRQLSVTKINDSLKCAIANAGDFNGRDSKKIKKPVKRLVKLRPGAHSVGIKDDNRSKVRKLGESNKRSSVSAQSKSSAGISTSKEIELSPEDEAMKASEYLPVINVTSSSSESEDDRDLEYDTTLLRLKRENIEQKTKVLQEKTKLLQLEKEVWEKNTRLIQQVMECQKRIHQQDTATKATVKKTVEISKSEPAVSTTSAPNETQTSSKCSKTQDKSQDSSAMTSVLSTNSKDNACETAHQGPAKDVVKTNPMKEVTSPLLIPPSLQTSNETSYPRFSHLHSGHLPLENGVKIIEPNINSDSGSLGIGVLNPRMLEFNKSFTIPRTVGSFPDGTAPIGTINHQILKLPVNSMTPSPRSLRIIQTGNSHALSLNPQQVTSLLNSVRAAPVMLVSGSCTNLVQCNNVGVPSLATFSSGQPRSMSALAQQQSATVTKVQGPRIQTRGVANPLLVTPSLSCQSTVLRHPLPVKRLIYSGPHNRPYLLHTHPEGTTSTFSSGTGVSPPCPVRIVSSRTGVISTAAEIVSSLPTTTETVCVPSSSTLRTPQKPVTTTQLVLTSSGRLLNIQMPLEYMVQSAKTSPSDQKAFTVRCDRRSEGPKYMVKVLSKEGNNSMATVEPSENISKESLVSSDDTVVVNSKDTGSVRSHHSHSKGNVNLQINDQSEVAQPEQSQSKERLKRAIQTKLLTRMAEVGSSVHSLSDRFQEGKTMNMKSRSDEKRNSDASIREATDSATSMEADSEEKDNTVRLAEVKMQQPRKSKVIKKKKKKSKSDKGIQEQTWDVVNVFGDAGNGNPVHKLVLRKSPLSDEKSNKRKQKSNIVEKPSEYYQSRYLLTDNKAGLSTVASGLSGSICSTGTYRSDNNNNLSKNETVVQNGSMNSESGKSGSYTELTIGKEKRENEIRTSQQVRLPEVEKRMTPDRPVFRKIDFSHHSKVSPSVIITQNDRPEEKNSDSTPERQTVEGNVKIVYEPFIPKTDDADNGKRQVSSDIGVSLKPGNTSLKRKSQLIETFYTTTGKKVHISSDDSGVASPDIGSHHGLPQAQSVINSLSEESAGMFTSVDTIHSSTQSRSKASIPDQTSPFSMSLGTNKERFIKTKFIILKGDLCDRWLEVKKHTGFGQMSDPKFVHYLLRLEEARQARMGQSVRQQRAPDPDPMPENRDCPPTEPVSSIRSNHTPSPVFLDVSNNVSALENKVLPESPVILHVQNGSIQPYVLKEDHSYEQSEPANLDSGTKSEYADNAATWPQSPDARKGWDLSNSSTNHNNNNNARDFENNENPLFLEHLTHSINDADTPKVKDEPEDTDLSPQKNFVISSPRSVPENLETRKRPASPACSCPSCSKKPRYLSKAAEGRIAWAVNLFRDWLRDKGENECFERQTGHWLDLQLVQFYLTARDDVGLPFSTDTLQDFRRALSLYLSSCSSSSSVAISIALDQQYHLSNSTLFKLFSTRPITKEDNEKMKAMYICDEDMEKLYSSKTLSDVSPVSLAFKVWFDITFHLCSTKFPADFWRNLKHDDLEFEVDVNGVFFCFAQNVVPVEGKDRKMYATPDDPNRCPVRTTSLYLSKLNKQGTALFQQPRQKWTDNIQLWYKSMPVSREKLDNMMSTISQKAKLSNIYNNNCVMATASLKRNKYF